MKKLILIALFSTFKIFAGNETISDLDSSTDTIAAPAANCSDNGGSSEGPESPNLSPILPESPAAFEEPDTLPIIDRTELLEDVIRRNARLFGYNERIVFRVIELWNTGYERFFTRANAVFDLMAEARAQHNPEQLQRLDNLLEQLILVVLREEATAEAAGRTAPRAFTSGDSF